MHKQSRHVVPHVSPASVAQRGRVFAAVSGLGQRSMNRTMRLSPELVMMTPGAERRQLREPLTFVILAVRLT